MLWLRKQSMQCFSFIFRKQFASAPFSLYDDADSLRHHKIRAMTDKELAHLLGESVTCENCLAHSDVCEMEYDNPADVPSCEQI